MAEKIYDLCKKITIIRDALECRSWKELEGLTGISEQKLSRFAKDTENGTRSIKPDDSGKLALAAGFELEHTSWIDRSIPENERLRRMPGRADTAGKFQDYLFPLRGLSVRMNYLQLLEDAEADTKKIYGGLWNDRQGMNAQEDFPVAAELRFQPIWIREGLSFGFSKLTVSMSVSTRGSNDKPAQIVSRYNDRATEHDLGKDVKISKPNQGGGVARWDISRSSSYLDGAFEFPPDKPLATIQPAFGTSRNTAVEGSQPNSTTVHLKVLGHRFDGTLVDSRGGQPLDTHKEQVLKQLLGDAFDADEMDAREGGQLELSHSIGLIDYRYQND